VDVNPYLHSATVQDLFHTGARSNFAPRDVVAQPFLSMMDSLGWNDLHYPGGAQVDNYHVIIGETRVYGGKGSGYNGHCSDFEHNPYHKCEDVNDGALLFPFPNDFFNAYKQFADTLGAACSVDGNVAFGSLEEQLWMIKHTNAWLWVAGVEDNVARNDYIWPHGGTYRRKVQAWIDVIKKQYPNVKTAIDVAPVWRKDQRSRRWNDSLRTMKSDYVRAYDQIGDLLDDWTDNPKENLDSIVRALEVINPARFKASFQKYNRPAAIIQWYAPFEGNFPPNYRFTNFSCLYMGLEYEFFYKDQVGDRNIAYAAQWNLRQLIDKKNNPKPEYWAQKNYNKMFGKGRKWLKVSGADSKLHVYGSVNPLTGDYQVAIVNPTSSTFPLPSISFDGQASNRYSAFSIHSNDLLSTRPEIGTPKQIDSYSTMIVRFKRSQ
jgi:hypothetical protein